MDPDLRVDDCHLVHCLRALAYANEGYLKEQRYYNNTTHSQIHSSHTLGTDGPPLLACINRETKIEALTIHTISMGLQRRRHRPRCSARLLLLGLKSIYPPQPFLLNSDPLIPSTTSHRRPKCNFSPWRHPLHPQWLYRSLQRAFAVRTACPLEASKD